MEKQIKWSGDRSETEKMLAIVERAEAMGILSKADRMHSIMDIDACHSNGTPLDLDGLLTAEPYDFSHDISGITYHIDRTTGELTGCFLPRYAILDTEGVPNAQL